ncbi:MAG: TrkA family potassium uptake protein [candidate division NC10 bacterium]|nr:TrkA family potassium uptake protein [candidate division NC10 bacterium]
MYAIIVGGGGVGYYLTKELLSLGHEVTVIERDEKRYQSLSEELGEVAVLGECDATILEEAGARRADVLIAVTGEDETNLVACLIAKRFLQVPRVIARVANPKNRVTFNKLGIDLTVSSTDIICNLIEQEAFTQEIFPLLSLKRGELEIVEIRLPTDSPALGLAIRDLDLPADSVLISVIRGEQIIFPRGDTTFLLNDAVLALTAPKNVEELKKVFYR